MLVKLKTFKLSKNALVHLLYILLIITTTISVQINDEPANPKQTDDKNNNPDENIPDKTNLISSNNDNNENTAGKKNILQGVFERMNFNKLKNNKTKPNEDKINIMDPKKKNTVEESSFKDQQLEADEEDPFKDMKLGIPSEELNTGDDKLEEAPEQNNKQEIKRKKKKKKKKKNKNKKENNRSESINSEKKDTRETDSVKDQQSEVDEEDPFKDMKLDIPSEELNTKDVEEEKATEQKTQKSTEDTSQNKITEDEPKDLTLSSLENVGIVKIKNKQNATSEMIRKEKKRTKFREFTPSGENARIYCTFLGDVLKMYNKVKKRFVGHFCHAIVFGAPINLKHNQVHLSNNMKSQLNKIDPQRGQSLLIVIMKHSSYDDWEKALINPNQLVINIIHTVINYKIDGIQFSNLQRTGVDQTDTQMVNNLITFLKKLLKTAKTKKHDLKIGITIQMNSQWIKSSFTSFDQLNTLVTWYSYQTISMVVCTSKYKTTSTSPLKGEVSLDSSLESIKVTDIDMSKLVVGIQLFPNKIDEMSPLTYEELCSTSKNSWDKWCAAHPDELRLKGLFLRDYEIGGVQLYYMHSDDYRSTCGCYSFPLIRALLRGLINTQTKEQCDFFTAHN